MFSLEGVYKYTMLSLSIFTDWPCVKHLTGWLKIALLVGLCVPNYHMHNDYVMYIIAM